MATRVRTAHRVSVFANTLSCRLPLDIIMLVISELLPKIQELQSTLNPANANGAIVDLIKSTNLEHILPKPSPLSPRRFVVSKS